MNCQTLSLILLFIYSLPSGIVHASWDNATELSQDEGVSEYEITIREETALGENGTESLIGINDTPYELSEGERVFIVHLQDDTVAALNAERDDKQVKYEDLEFDGVDVRIYTPLNGAASDAAVVYLHGGGWTSGDKDNLHNYLIDWTNRTAIPFLSIYYQLAPDNPYPSAYRDSLTAVKYFISHAELWEINPERVALMGDSAGGNLVAAVCLGLRDEGFEPQPVEQLLLYPSLQAIDFDSPSFMRTSPEIREAAIQYIIQYALGHLDGDVSRVYEAALRNEHTSPYIKQQMAATTLNLAAIPISTYPENFTIPHNRYGNAEIWERISPVFLDPYFMPLMAANFSNLPDAFILVGSNDPMLDDAIWLKEALLSEGADVNFVMVPEGYHGILSTPAYLKHLDYWDRVAMYVEAKLVSGAVCLHASTAAKMIAVIVFFSIVFGSLKG